MTFQHFNSHLSPPPSPQVIYDQYEEEEEEMFDSSFASECVLL